MSDRMVELLSKKIGESNARCLADAGLLNDSLFQYRQSINGKVARLLCELPSLRIIQFGSAKPDGKSLECLNSEVFAKRKDIALRVYSDSDLWADITFLRYLPEVERFDWESDTFGSIEPLRSFKTLRHLGLGLTQPKPKIDLQFLPDFGGTLESLSLAGDFKNASKVIPQLGGLRSAWFVSTKLDDFQFLEGLPIEILGNYGSRVKSFDSVRYLKGLKRLWVKTNTKLEGIEFVEPLSKLERIELFFVSKLTKFPKCDHLTNLKLIIAYTCNRLSDISELQKLSDVKISASGKSIENGPYQTDDFTWSYALDISGRVL